MRRIKSLKPAHAQTVQQQGKAIVNSKVEFTAQDDGIYSQMLNDVDADMFDGLAGFLYCREDYSIIRACKQDNETADPREGIALLEEGIDYFPDSTGKGDTSEAFQATLETKPEVKPEEPNVEEVAKAAGIDLDESLDETTDHPIPAGKELRAEYINSFTVPVLYEMCKELGITNYKRKKKQGNEFASAILAAEAEQGELDLAKFES